MLVLSPYTSTSLIELGFCSTSSVILGMTYVPTHLGAGEFRDLVCSPPSPKSEQKTCCSHQMSLPADECPVASVRAVNGLIPVLTGGRNHHFHRAAAGTPLLLLKLLLAGAKEEMEICLKSLFNSECSSPGGAGYPSEGIPSAIFRMMSKVQGPNSSTYLNTYVILSLCFVPLVLAGLSVCLKTSLNLLTWSMPLEAQSFLLLSRSRCSAECPRHNKLIQNVPVAPLLLPSSDFYSMNLTPYRVVLLVGWGTAKKPKSNEVPGLKY